MPLANIIEDDVHTPYLRAFDVEYTVENLGLKAEQYQLDTAALAGNYQVDLAQLEQIFHQTTEDEHSDALEQLFVLIATWPSNMGWEDFCTRINQCVECWITSTQTNTSITTITNLLRCLHIQNNQQPHISQQFHLYLFEILGESLHLYEHNQIHYLLNHDAVTNLPNTHLLLQEIEYHVAHGNGEALSLLSIRFLIEAWHQHCISGAAASAQY